MRWLALLVFVATAAHAQPPPATMVIADILEAPRAGQRCRVVLRIVSVEGDAPAVRSGDTVDASVSCYARTLHQMHRGGRLRFRLEGSATARTAHPVGGRILQRERTDRKRAAAHFSS